MRLLLRAVFTVFLLATTRHFCSSLALGLPGFPLFPFIFPLGLRGLNCPPTPPLAAAGQLAEVDVDDDAVAALARPLAEVRVPVVLDLVVRPAGQVAGDQGPPEANQTQD
jgi:hypothetical protein